MKYKPCPFCGVNNADYTKNGIPAPTPIVAHDEDTNTRYVECENCGARGPVSSIHPEAVDRWNMRFPS